MAESKRSDKSTQELRVVLNEAATVAYESMVARLKEEMPTIKLHPSQVVSFLVADFFFAHFEKDKAVLIAEFFDSDAFYEAARRQAKGSDNYEEQMASALVEAKAIRAKRRRKPLQKEKSVALKSEVGTT